MSGAAIEHHLEIPRTARYWTLGDAASEPAEIWFVLHGYRQLARRFLRRFEPLDDGTRLIVAPEGLSRFYTGTESGRHGPAAAVGATWMTREDRDTEIRDYVRYLDRLADTILSRWPKAAPVTVLGFSQGVATASRWTVLGSMHPRRLILWGDFLPPDLDFSTAAARWSDTEVVLMRGDRDKALADGKLAEAERDRMAAAGLSPEHRTYEGGHDIEQRALQALAAGGRL